MYPGTEPAALAAMQSPDLVSEGSAYAAALLGRIAAGTSNAADFAAVVGFLQCYPMLYGFGAVILDALRGGSRDRPERSQ